MTDIITFNSAQDIYNMITSGQDLYCLDTQEFFTSIDDYNVAIYALSEQELMNYADACIGTDAAHIDEVIPQLATEILEPDIITNDGVVISPVDSGYMDADLAEYDPSNVVDMLSDLVGRRFIYAMVDDLSDAGI